MGRQNNAEQANLHVVGELVHLRPIGSGHVLGGRLALSVGGGEVNPWTGTEQKLFVR
jgi:hypothetical protein